MTAQSDAVQVNGHHAEPVDLAPCQPLLASLVVSRFIDPPRAQPPPTSPPTLIQLACQLTI